MRRNVLCMAVFPHISNFLNIKLPTWIQINKLFATSFIWLGIKTKFKFYDVMNLIYCNLLCYPMAMTVSWPFLQKVSSVWTVFEVYTIALYDVENYFIEFRSYIDGEQE